MNSNPYESPGADSRGAKRDYVWREAGEPPNLPSASSRWLLILLLMGYAALAHFNRVGITVAGSEIFIPKVGISETDMGWVYAAFLIVYTLGMLPGGWLIDRIGAAKALTLLGITMGTLVALTGSLGWLTSTPGGLWLGLILIRGFAGVGNVPLHPGAAHVVSDVMPNRWRATANGMVTAGAILGIAFCYPGFGRLIDLLTWPWAFIVSGGALFGYGLLWRLFATPLLKPPHPLESGARNVPAREPVLQSTIEGPLPARRVGTLYLLTFSYAAYGYFQYLFFYWMNYYFATVLNMPIVEARYWSFLVTLSQGAGMILGGLGTDAICGIFGTNWGRRLIVMAGMGLSALFALVAVTQQSYVVLCLAISMGALGMCEGVFWTTATDIGGKSRGLAGALMNTGGNLGGFISPVLTPFLAEKLDWPYAIAVACAINGIGGLAWLGIKSQPAASRYPEQP